MDSSVFSTPKTKRNVKNNGNRTQAVVVGGDIESELIEEGDCQRRKARMSLAYWHWKILFCGTARLKQAVCEVFNLVASAFAARPINANANDRLPVHRVCCS